MNYKSKLIFLLLITAFIIASCGANKTELKIKYEMYTLENGLEVILHEDKSDPIAAVAI